MKIDAKIFKESMYRVSTKMREEKEYLLQLDAEHGDGDLGISMSNGFDAVSNFLSQTEENDIGRLLLGASRKFNEAAPSSLGTILSIGMMGMARFLKGKTEIDLAEISMAFRVGMEDIMKKAGSKPGEKTVLDALNPAIIALESAAINQEDLQQAFRNAAKAAQIGAESTKNMKPVHGRSAYYKNKDTSYLDGGAVAASIIFSALAF